MTSNINLIDEDVLRRCEAAILTDPGIRSVQNVIAAHLSLSTPKMIVTEDGCQRIEHGDEDIMNGLKAMIVSRRNEILDSFGVTEHEMGFELKNPGKK